MRLIIIAALGCSSAETAASDVRDAASSDTLAAADSAAFDSGGGDAGFNVDAPAMDATPVAPARVYANTDKDLWAMDPVTKNVTRVGAFVNADGSAFAETMTDVAVNAGGKLAANSIGKIFDLELPATTGDVKATVRLTIPFGTRLYALAYAPKGVLGPDEELVGGDAAGDLYWIPAAGAPQKIGGFGVVSAGDPGLGAAGNFWQLSGDIAFFLNDGAPIGLATIRPCDKDGDPSTCRNGNDVLVEIDVAAMSKKSATSNLKKRFIGGAGTGFGRLYGVGAWEDKVYAFQRVATTAAGTTALLVAVSLSDGKGTTVKDFPEIAAARNGWSGAGVTTSAKIFLPK